MSAPRQRHWCSRRARLPAPKRPEVLLSTEFERARRDADLQTNSAIDRRKLTFVYRYQPPFGTLQLAYQRGTAEFSQVSDQGNTLFVKLATVF